MNGLQLIAAERERQISAHLFSLEHDDKHVKHELCAAAECYEQAGDQIAVGNRVSPYPPATWPWEQKEWKPSEDKIRNWIKAGALYRAEGDRYLRRNVPMCKMNCDGLAERCAIKIDLALAKKPEPELQPA